MTISICPDCNGEGFRSENDRYDGWVSIACKRCNNTGRIKTRKYSFEIPYGTDDGNIRAIDNQIYEWIRLIPTMLKKSEPKKIKTDAEDN